MAHATTTRNELQAEIRVYLVGTFLKSRQDTGLQDDEDLLLVLNSLQLLRMVIELESRFGIAIANSELTPESLGTVERIAAFVERKRLQ